MILAADIAKAKIDTFDGKRWRTVPNQERDIRGLLDLLPSASIVALEPTSFYGDLLAGLAYEAGHTVYMIQPSWVKGYRSSEGVRAKTDKIDARQIHGFVLEKHDKGKLHPWRPLPGHLQNLKQLVRQRQSLADDIARMRQCYKALHMSPEHIKALLESLLKGRKDLDKAIKNALKEIPGAQVLLSIPGIGIQIAATLAVALEHIPSKSADAFIGYLGLDPLPAESGNAKPSRRISKAGSVSLRRAAYLAAMAACRLDAWKERYQALKDKGLKPKQALVALAKKIATTAFQIHRMQVTFQADKVAYKKNPTKAV